VTVTDSVAIPSAKATPGFWADMNKYAPGAAKSGQSLLAWAAVQIIKDIAARDKAYDNSSLLAAIKTTSSLKVEGLAGSLNYSSPDPNPAYARVFARYDYAYKVTGGTFSPEFSGSA
jgi:hypothetical protein